MLDVVILVSSFIEDPKGIKSFSLTSYALPLWDGGLRVHSGEVASSLHSYRTDNYSYSLALKGPIIKA